MPKFVTMTIESAIGSPYSQSRPVSEPKLSREKPDEYDRRTWLDKAHFDKNDQMIIPAQQLIRAVQGAVRKFGHQVPGKGKSTYTKFFDSGIMMAPGPLEHLVLRDGKGKPMLKHNAGEEGHPIVREMVYVAADGKPNSGTRVWRNFPQVHQWQGQIKLMIIDDTIGEAIFEQCMEEAGNFVGVGRWRPEKRGNNGRFEVTKFEWTPVK